jgi:homoserine dehydrogenase
LGEVEIGRGGEVRASVRPTPLPIVHPLASVAYVTNAVTFETEILGDVTVSGPGAGRVETGYAVVVDILAIVRNRGGLAP